MYPNVNYWHIIIGFLICWNTYIVHSHSKVDQLVVTLLHTNDVHSRFRQTNKFGGFCSQDEMNENLCYGGFSRLHQKVNEIRATHENVLYLSGGNYYQGTICFDLHKWAIVSKLVNILNHTAMALGPKEFDEGLSGLVPFLDATSVPVVSANIDTTKESSVQGKFQKSVVVDIDDGVKVGIIGYITEDTPDLSNTGNLKFEDVVESVNQEAERLYNHEGVKILIALGNAGYNTDLLIAKEVSLIDVVVGGHSNTFLYSGESSPDVEVIVDNYPVSVKQLNGRLVPVVQAYAFGKYLGYLNLTFNTEGEVVNWEGNPILLNSSVEEDSQVIEELVKWDENGNVSRQLSIGKTKVFLNGSDGICGVRECNLGNLITDAIIHSILKFPDEMYWSDVKIAIFNAGGIRGSIDDFAKKGHISINDVLAVLPFQGPIDLVEIKGSDLRAVFEFAIAGYDPKSSNSSEKFLQVSGIKIVYDVTLPDFQRVKQIRVRCSQCRIPKYFPLDDDETYKVAVPNYLAEGGDGYVRIRETRINHRLTGMLDTVMLIKYIESNQPITHGIEGRIVFQEGSSCNIDDTKDVDYSPSPPPTSDQEQEDSTPGNEDEEENREEVEKAGSQENAEIEEKVEDKGMQENEESVGNDGFENQQVFGTENNLENDESATLDENVQKRENEESEEQLENNEEEEKAFIRD